MRPVAVVPVRARHVIGERGRHPGGSITLTQRTTAQAVAKIAGQVAILARSADELDHTFAELRQIHECVFAICTEVTHRAERSS